MSQDYTVEDLLRLIAMPGVTVEEIRLALDLPLEGFLGLSFTGDLDAEAIEEIKQKARDVFGNASAKLMVVPDNWTITPIPLEPTFSEEGHEVSVPDKWAEAAAPRTNQAEMKDQLESASWSNDWSTRQNEKIHFVEPQNKLLRDVDSEQQRAPYGNPAWWEFTGVTPDLTADGKLVRPAAPDDFDKTIDWVPPQVWRGGWDKSETIFLMTFVFVAVVGTIYGVLSALGGW